MKIIHVISDMEFGGAAKQLTLAASRLAKNGWEARIIVLGREGPLCQELEGVSLLTLDWTRLIDVRPLMRLRAELRSFRPAIVHVWCLSALRWTAPLVPLKMLTAGSMVTAHASVRQLNQIDRWILRRAGRVIAMSGEQAAGLEAAGVPVQGIRIIPPAVVIDRDAGPTVGKWDGGVIDHKARLIVCAGPLKPHKGFREAIWAFDILRYLYDELDLVFVGDGPERAALERFSHAIGAAGRVHFLGVQNDVASWLARAEIVWVPSERACGINVALEAMAVGRPVVAGRVAPLKDIVADGETGFLVPPLDKVALARQTRVLLEDRALARSMGEAARQRALNCFSADQLALHLAELYGVTGA
jgi:glycosyltransferase involved in cell wall biosynthesis